MIDEPFEVIEARAESLAEAQAEFLQQLVAHRRKHKLSQQVVADRMGVSQPTVHALERHDANPTLSTIRRYALAVQVRLEHKIVDDCTPNDRFSEIIRGSQRKSMPMTFTERSSARLPDDWLQNLRSVQRQEATASV